MVSDRSAWKRWSKIEAKAGERCYLDETRYGWTVRDLDSGELLVSYGSFDRRTRVYRSGDPSLGLLNNDTQVIIVDPTNSLATTLPVGSSVRVLGPSKHRGRIGVVAKHTGRYTVVEPGKGVFQVERDFLVPIITEFKEIP